MKILTWDTPNFGDRLNELVWPHYIPRYLNDDPNQALVGIGSLLNHRLPSGPTKWILGSGVGHGEPPTVDSTWRILWVRGPRTAAYLGLPDCRFITDGAVLLADMLKPGGAKIHSCSFIPHCSAVDLNALDALEEICGEAGIHLINPHWPVSRVLDAILRSERIITEALHGAILADAFHIPWQPVARRGVLSFKWMDWTESLGLTYRPTLLPYRPQWLSSTPHRRLSRRLAFTLLKPSAKLLLERRLALLRKDGTWLSSRNGLVEDKITEMKECLDDLRERLDRLAA